GRHTSEARRCPPGAVRPASARTGWNGKDTKPGNRILVIFRAAGVASASDRRYETYETSAIRLRRFSSFSGEGPGARGWDPRAPALSRLAVTLLLKARHCQTASAY